MLLGYWKLDDGSLIAADSAPSPTDLKLATFAADGIMWRYLDEPFPPLLSANQTHAGTYYGTLLPGLSQTRALRGLGRLKLAQLTIPATSSVTLEFYVNWQLFVSLTL